MNPIPLLVASKPILHQTTLYVDSSFNPLSDTLTGGMIHKLMTAADLKTLSARAYEKQLAKFDALASHTWEDMCALFHMTVEQAEKLLQDNISIVKQICKALHPRRLSQWANHLKVISRMYAGKAGRAQIQTYTAKFHHRFFGCFRLVTKRCQQAVQRIADFILGRKSSRPFDELADEYMVNEESREAAIRDHQKRLRREKLSKQRSAFRLKIELERQAQQLTLRRARRA